MSALRMGHVLAIAALAIGCQRHQPQPSAGAPAPAASRGALPVGLASCDSYLRRVADCKALSQPAREAFLLGVRPWQRAAELAGDTAIAATRSCDGVSKLAAPQLAELGC